MFDEMERLRTAEELCGLLRHYADLGASDRQAWQDRLGEWPGMTNREMARLHGELLAYGWIEQNTGQTPVLLAGKAPACYRITTTGMRALKLLRADEADAA